MRAEMTWAGSPTALATTFDVPGTDFDGEELRPRGERQGVLQVVPVQQVPEPGTLALMGPVLAGFGLFTRRRRPPR